MSVRASRSRSRIPTDRHPVGTVARCDAKQGFVLVTGPTGFGQVDHARLDDRAHQPRAVRCTSSRSRTPSSTRTNTGSRRSTNARSASTRSRSRAALRSALREDPDVILVGEMRDPETIQFALTLAETGHLVFATLAHERRVAVARPHLRRLPARTPDPDPGAARGIACRGRLAAPVPARSAAVSSPRSSSCRERRGAEPHPRGSHPPVAQRDPQWPGRGHADARVCAQRAGRLRSGLLRRRGRAVDPPKEILRRAFRRAVAGDG